ncbi:unnamed protein product [Paramecium sonneborni]|uniref:NAD(P)(+)--arginine ADP-ribosyltransferase n=1 Tax=Paramecium sonneborni TaxID=65129 RepID=A0A8S1P9H1_9CILI|nr:unnamed protein product [Paramecium sonneborni]
MYQYEDQIEDNEELPPIVEELSLGSGIPQFFNQQQQQLLLFLDANNLGVNEHLTIITEPQVTIEELKKQCKNKYTKIDFFDDCNFIYKGRKLYTHKTLNEYNIDNNSVLKVEFEVIFGGGCDVFTFLESIKGDGERIQIKIKHVNKNKEYGVELPENIRVPRTQNWKLYKGQDCIENRYTHLNHGDTIEIHEIHYGGCFPFYAPITLSDKSTKMILEIEKGDKILCYDEVSKQYKTSTVKDKRKTDDYFDLIRIETENGIIDCTADHPFYTEFGWKAFEPNPDFHIQKLTKMDKLLNQENIFIQIVSINHLDQKAQVYNLIMEHPNNYVVFGFLAHNMNKISININGQIEELEFFPDMPIQLIKALIYKKKGIKIENQQLYFHGILMKDENTVRDYQCYPIENDRKMEKMEKMCPTIEVSTTMYEQLDLKIVDNPIQKQQQQQQTFSNDKQKIIPIKIITQKSSYQILINKKLSVKILKDVVYTLEDQSKQGFLLLNGYNLEQNMDQIKIQDLKIEAIYSIPCSEGVSLIKFMNSINSLELKQLSDLQESLNFLNFNIEEFFNTTLAQINSNQEKRKIFQKYELHHLIAIILWTSNKIYRKLNIDLGCQDYGKWKKYLKCLLDGLKYSDYHKGICGRGFKNYQNTQIYQKGKVVQWCQVSSFSINRKVAEKFSNEKGMIFLAYLISAKNISQLSLYPHEDEVLIPPFTSFKVLDVVINENQPIIVIMKEFPLAKTVNIILWVDDNPQNNYKLAQDLETKNPNLSIIFCQSTDKAISIVKMYRWLIYLKTSQFKIVSNMVRKEKAKMNYLAGVQLLQRLNTKLNYRKQILFFVTDENYSKQSLEQNDLKNYIVTNQVSVLDKFVNLK